MQGRIYDGFRLTASLDCACKQSVTLRYCFAMTDLQSFVLELNPLVSRRNGAQVAKHLALPVGPGSTITPATKQFVDKIRRSNIIGYCENNFADSNACGIIAFRLMALVSLVDGDLETAYRHESAAYDLTLDYVSNKEDNTAWIVPVLVRISNDLRVVATMVSLPELV
jgi:hypothetical protein